MAVRHVLSVLDIATWLSLRQPFLHTGISLLLCISTVVLMNLAAFIALYVCLFVSGHVDFVAAAGTGPRRGAGGRGTKGQV